MEPAPEKIARFAVPISLIERLSEARYDPPVISMSRVSAVCLGLRRVPCFPVTEAEYSTMSPLVDLAPM